MTDHPSGMPEVDVPGILARLAGDPPWTCAVCLYQKIYNPRDAITFVAGNAVCGEHIEEAFTLENDARTKREERYRTRLDELKRC